MYIHLEDQKQPRRTVLPTWIIVAIWIITLGACALYAIEAHAEAVFKAEAGGVTITLYTEDCKLKNLVSNLQKRATWTEKGKTYEGCVGGTPFGIFMFYFAEDKSVAVVPSDAFVRVTGV